MADNVSYPTADHIDSSQGSSVVGPAEEVSDYVNAVPPPDDDENEGESVPS